MIEQEEIKVEYIHPHLGSDIDVVNAAKVSFAKEITELTDKNKRLIHYLARHKHWTPFGQCYVKLRVCVPIFIARQLVKHSIGLCWNEESRRYIDSDPSFFVPKVWHGRPEGSIKQGSGEPIELQEKATLDLLDWYESSIELYTKFLKKYGVCPEQARMVLPLGSNVHFIWSGSLAAWARVYGLRSEENAQKEAQEFADKLSNIIQPLFPISWEALTKANNKE